MSVKSFRAGHQDEENIRFLHHAGYSIGEVIRKGISDKVRSIKEGISENKIKMEGISIRENEIVAYGPIVPGTREGMLRLVNEKRISFLPDNKGFVISQDTQMSATELL